MAAATAELKEITGTDHGLREPPRCGGTRQALAPSISDEEDRNVCIVQRYGNEENCVRGLVSG